MQNEEKRLIEIESKILEQDFLLEELHQVIYQQQKTIDTLELKIKTLIQRFGNSAAQAENNLRPSTEKPPHY